MLPDRVSLTVHHRGRADAVTLERSRPLVVGRASPADVIVEDSQVSRRHVQFELLDDGLWVEDLGSKNGTLAGGQRIGRRRLAPGEDVRFGSVVVVPGLPRRGRRRAGFETYERFLERAEDELERARVFGRPFSVLFLRTRSGAETPSLEAGALRSVDRVSVFAPTMLLVSLPERDEPAATEVASRLTASIGEGASCGVAEYPSAGATAEELVAAARNAAFASEARPAQARAALAELVAESAAMRRVRDRARELSGSDEPIVLFGEVGTGKALVARAVHEESARSGGFARVRCGDARSSDFSTVLSAALESSRRGTIFLDEIGALALEAQALLARALETATGVRVIAATSDDLDARARDGGIRPDLLRALDAARVTIPPLRHRRDDLRVLAQRFLDDAARVDDGAARAFDETAMQALLSYAWPGNARELKSVVMRASALAAGRSVTAIDLPQPVRNAAAEPVRTAVSAGEPHDAPGATLKELVQSYEKAVIERALDAAGGKRAEAARALGLPLRTLAHKIASLGIGRRR